MNAQGIPMTSTLTMAKLELNEDYGDTNYQTLDAAQLIKKTSEHFIRRHEQIKRQAL